MFSVPEERRQNGRQGGLARGSSHLGPMRNNTVGFRLWGLGLEIRLWGLGPDAAPTLGLRVVIL